MRNDISKKYLSVGLTASQRATIKIGFLFLIVFAFLRPSTLIGSNVAVSGIKFLDVVGIGLSYFLFLPVIMGLKQYKFDRVTFFLILFCLYVFDSIFWGSEIRKVGQTILPLILFISVRMFIKESNQAKVMLIALVFGFLLPITWSTYNVVLGRAIELVEWHSKVPRHTGAFSGSHTLAYSMLFFSFLYCILHHIYRFKNILNRFIIGFYLILSIYCLYETHTRTAIFGFVVFWFIYLWGNNKKLFCGAVVLFFLTIFIFHSQIYILIFKIDKIDLNIATSGRVEIFETNTQIFMNSNIFQKIFGHGYSKDNLFSYHNDFIGLLMSYGIIGLFLHLILLFYLLLDIFLCKDNKTKYLFGAILISVAAMEFGSNAVVFRFESSQYFWLIMGLFYCISQNKNGVYGAK